MTGKDLTPKQASDLHHEIFRIATYIDRMATRMAQLQFAPYDKLFRLVQNAERALATLSNETYQLRTQLHPHSSKRSTLG